MKLKTMLVVLTATIAILWSGRASANMCHAGDPDALPCINAGTCSCAAPTPCATCMVNRCEDAAIETAYDFVMDIVVSPMASGTVDLGVKDYTDSAACTGNYYCRDNGVIATNGIKDTIAYDVFSSGDEWYAFVQDVGGANGNSAQGFTLQVKCDPGLLTGQGVTYTQGVHADAPAGSGTTCETLTTDPNAMPSVSGFIGIPGAENGSGSAWVQWTGSVWQICAKSYPGGPATRAIGNALRQTHGHAWTGSGETESQTFSFTALDGTSYPTTGCDMFVLAAATAYIDWSTGYPRLSPTQSPDLAWAACASP